MRDLMIFGMMCLLVPLSLRNGFAAYLLWGWAGLAGINAYVFGFMQSFPFVMFFALVCLGLFVIGKDSEKQAFQVNRTTLLYLLFGVQAVLSASFAYEGHPRNWEIATNILKTILFCLLMPMLVTSRFRIHALVLMIAISTGYHALIDGLKFLLSGGGHLARGVAKFGDNNHFALVLVMALPLLIYCYRYAANKLVRMGFLAMIPLVILAVVATRSRGGLACLMASGVWLVLTGRRKVAGLVGVILAATLVIQLAPAEWSERMNTIGAAGEDSSFLGRVGAWRISSAIAIGNPLLGGGFHAVEVPQTWRNFRDAPSLLGFVNTLDLEGFQGGGRAAHSIYFETMGDLGFVGFFIFMAILINALVTARTVASMAKAAGPRLDWARDLAEMLTISAIAFVTGGALLSAAYFELPYVLFMLLEVLKIHVRQIARIESDKIPYAMA